MKIYFSISCHTALLDAIVAADLIKFLLKKEDIQYFINLTITDPKIIKEKHNIKNFFNRIQIAKIPNVRKKIYKYYKQNIGSVRLFNSIISNGISAIKKDYDFIIYLNSGSWFLDFSPFKNLINFLKKNNKVVGCRIQAFLKGKSLFFDDHFLVVNLLEAKKLNFYKVSKDSRAYVPLDFYYGAIHKCLFSWFTKLPLSSVYVYTCMSEVFNEHGTLGSRFIPISYDYKFKLLHSNYRFKKILPLRYAYLERFGYKASSAPVEIELKKWKKEKKNISEKLVNNEKIYFLKSSLYSRIRMSLQKTIFKRIIGIEENPIAKVETKKIT